MTTELIRQLRRRRTLFGLLGIASVPVLLALAFYFTSGDGGGGGGGDPTGLFDLARQSGLNFTIMSVAAVSPFLLLSVIALFTGDTVSSEAGWSSLRYLLTRPVNRSRLLGRKLVVGLQLSVLAAVVMTISAAVCGLIAFGGGGMITPFGNLAVAEAVGRIVLILAYILWSAAWVACLAFALSTVTDEPVGAVAGTIVIVIVVQILDNITALGSIRDYLPVHEANAWLGLLADPPRYADLVRGMWLQVPYIIVILGLAWRHFLRKDVLS
ncbi:ABC transporter permease [Euzebya tangerina]|uniref:ABC transporter permease n=1 Tax=Euzebya tangerina TaxID=591198 RepID=UPI000E323555|nr:ABC transporter permease [Euzebya tangerina]